ncbi:MULTISPECIES: DUF1419 domain-containing protein [Rhizobium]|uniref:DUF1419 domain-containing protein n=1 Tax=Rhizobium binae TaxID=1138190 RepID=A0ABV2MKX0_9HYPH|nr:MULTISPECIES: DUF1419 domain-containing protein [Rhizobium]NKL49590.1 DUF1419 domain-containing protein [Rhizobium leguminosarum bv. viciae]MBX4937069.1 DUF1419 domain-containing protein [Rhizobium binae]MBX4943719.1 DUF1419 domain-containing protein [Rhizobium binae]MBX4979163.1 DUF1419 domain-containing protein [Rhizobium binae]MBX4995900.1 DUF1419 domain-containing protein [Rhizobium binae]
MPVTNKIRKVFEGVATRREMFGMFDRHAQRPNRWDEDAAPLYAGEWFEIGEAEHDYMFEILPPLWIRGAMFAMREYLTGSVTSVFFALRIGGRIRYFHGYCDLSDHRAAEEMRRAIIERETKPQRAMSRDERLEHIWSITADAYRGYAGEDWPPTFRGRRVLALFNGTRDSIKKCLDQLSDDEIAGKLPVHLRHLPSPIAA